MLTIINLNILQLAYLTPIILLTFQQIKFIQICYHNTWHNATDERDFFFNKKIKKEEKKTPTFSIVRTLPYGSKCTYTCYIEDKFQKLYKVKKMDE